MNTHSRHSFTFEVGKRVRFYPDDVMHHDKADKSHLVLATIDVPEEEIDYNPLTEEGGVAHHQWIIIEGLSNKISGHWFQPKHWEDME